jgi:hypothetical protein
MPTEFSNKPFNTTTATINQPRNLPKTVHVYIGTCTKSARPLQSRISKSRLGESTFFHGCTANWKGGAVLDLARSRHTRLPFIDSALIESLEKDKSSRECRAKTEMGKLIHPLPCIIHQWSVVALVGRGLPYILSLDEFHWHQHVHSIPKLLIPPFAKARSGEALNIMA